MKVDPIRSATKFRKVRQLIAEHKQVREQIEVDIKHSDWSEEALVTYLMMETGIRPGSKEATQWTWDRQREQYIKTFGACSLQARHIRVLKNGVFLAFIGKKGVSRRVHVTNPYLAQELKRRKQALAPTDPIFQAKYWHVAEYVGLLGYTPKDFRTALGTMLARELVNSTPRESRTAREQKEICKQVAAQLGNTPAVTKSSYIDPQVWSTFNN